MGRASIAVFALNATKDFGERICEHLKITLSQHEEREFEDGEHKSRPLVSVRNKDVSLAGPSSNLTCPSRGRFRGDLTRNYVSAAEERSACGLQRLR